MSGLQSSVPELPVDESQFLLARAWLAAIVDSSEDAIVSKTLEGIVTTWNNGAERIFGYTSEEMVGKPIITIIPEDRKDEEPMILQRMRRGERVDHFETVRRRKDGTLLDVSVTISPVRDANGTIVGISKIARDITPMKQVQRELSRARDSAEQSRELALLAQQEAESANRAKDHFLSVLSHELRTPLTPVLGAISLIETDESLPLFIREQLSMIRRNVETEVRLVDDLLDLTRIARGKMSLHFEAVDAHAVIRNVIGMFQKEMDQKGLSVTTALVAKEFFVWADPGRFQQVMLNLVSNAVKFTPPQGSIMLRSENNGENLRIEIVDSGVGIDSELMPRLFRAFEQGEKSFARRFGGLGLGLSIVKSLIELHSGSIKVFSPGTGQGTTFTLELPTTHPMQQPRNGVKSLTDLNSPIHRILLVEDHADTRQVMIALLRSFGYSVAAASSVKQALELAARDKFDLLISDFSLPDGTGIDVIQSLKKYQPLKAIAITGFGQDEDVLRSQTAGFAIHLTKPINIDTLKEAIHEVMT